MALTFQPALISATSGYQVYDMQLFDVDDGIKKYIESMSITHRSKFVNNVTGFETTKHIFGAVTGNNLLVDIQIGLTGDLSRAYMQQLRRLAEGINGAGLALTFRDDWWSNYNYTCRWANAMDMAENTELLCGGTMQLESWAWSAI